MATGEGGESGRGWSGEGGGVFTHGAQEEVRGGEGRQGEVVMGGIGSRGRGRGWGDRGGR